MDLEGWKGRSEPSLVDQEVLKAELPVPEWCHQITTTQPHLCIQSKHQTNPLLNKRTGTVEGGTSFPEN